MPGSSAAASFASSGLASFASSGLAGEVSPSKSAALRQLLESHDSNVSPQGPPSQASLASSGLASFASSGRCSHSPMAILHRLGGTIQIDEGTASTDTPIQEWAHDSERLPTLQSSPSKPVADMSEQELEDEAVVLSSFDSVCDDCETPQERRLTSYTGSPRLSS